MSFLTAALDFRNRHFISNFQVKVAGLVTKKKIVYLGYDIKIKSNHGNCNWVAVRFLKLLKACGAHTKKHIKTYIVLSDYN